jgi:hypothetical protein
MKECDPRVSYAVVHDSGCGTPRRIAAVRRFGRDRSEADMPRASGAGRSDENDPQETSAANFAECTTLLVFNDVVGFDPDPGGRL